MLYYRASVKQRQKLQKADKAQNLPCPFCDITQLAGVVSETHTMRVVKNRVPYDIFDGVRVRDHLMITPITHRARLIDFSEKEKLEYFELLSKYEAQNYTVYSRGVKNKTRTVTHLHTHLLLLEEDPVKALFYIDRPYIVFHSGRFRKSNKIQG